jgi:hypothetical protein
MLLLVCCPGLHAGASLPWLQRERVAVQESCSFLQWQVTSPESPLLLLVLVGHQHVLSFSARLHWSMDRHLLLWVLQLQRRMQLRDQESCHLLSWRSQVLLLQQN